MTEKQKNKDAFWGKRRVEILPIGGFRRLLIIVVMAYLLVDAGIIPNILNGYGVKSYAVVISVGKYQFKDNTNHFHIREEAISIGRTRKIGDTLEIRYIKILPSISRTEDEIRIRTIHRRN